ncbi:E3 ubiquitin-protein ligase TRIM7-like [Lacerta agilis]|uniref:E3 ubiquitin-protein ligase TRIM7-like n=1 Tax=Lacerta agilis TaxID=80427 RepID=UPI0014195DF6|nr:E3 ubiquitin-protein ligase TRIM7-like [Lacerta agilis]
MAASGSHIQRLRDEATCSICLDYFKDPVTSPECGHSYCRSCLIQCWGESEAEASCPQCRERVQRRNLIPNWQLANVVEIAQNLSLQEGKEEGGKGGVCVKHQEPLKLFCKEDEALICLVCDRSKEHKEHQVIPLEEASEEYKGEICNHLEILRKEREEILAYQADLDKESKDLLKLPETERLKTVQKFRELRQFLEEQEKHRLNQVEEVEKEIAGRRDEQLARLSRKLSSLEKIIQEMEEKCQQPASELLQDVRSTLQRKGNTQRLNTEKVKLNSGLLREGAMAASGRPVENLCDEATCSICLDYFKDPVIIAECGHNFCRSCLIQYWGGSEAEASCPQCRERVQRRSLIPNRQLANVVELIENLSVQGGKEEERNGGVCEDHQEPLKLFCKIDEAPICVVCDRSKEHKHHEVIPLKEAFEEYKREICSRLEILRREREEILAYQADLDKESKDLFKLTETERLKTVEKFRELRQFLVEQEKRLLNHVEEVEKEIAGRRDEQLARLSRKLASLEKIIQEMEEKRQQPASELLQDVRRTLQRYEKRESPEKPLAFPPELKNRILESCDLNHLVEDAMKQFKDAVLYRKPIQKDVQSFRNLQRANVTLDPDTAHSRLILDRKSVRWGDKEQVLTDNPERFNSWPCVLGREGFTAGRHFWEVNVESGEWWALGVASKSVRRKGSFSFRPEEGIWAVGKPGGKYRAWTSPDPSPLSLNEDPRRIRVTLDYEGRRVSFSDADSGAELYTFSGASFSGETLLPFFYLWGYKSHLRIS